MATRVADKLISPLTIWKRQMFIWIHSKCVRVVSLTLCVSAFTACGVDFGDDAQEQELGEAEAALSGNPDPCATGTSPNYTSNTLTDVGDTATYVRSEAWINGICPEIGQDRATTIVDYPIPNYYQHQIAETYRFDVAPTFWGAVSTSWADALTEVLNCVNTTMATRIQRWDWATSQFVQLKYLEQSGVWIWDNSLTGKGHCDTPYFVYFHENYGNAQSVATDKYRVRTWAKQYDGSYATVWVTGRHTGIY